MNLYIGIAIGVVVIIATGVLAQLGWLSADDAKLAVAFVLGALGAGGTTAGAAAGKLKLPKRGGNV